MELVDKLEDRFNDLLNKISELKEENQRLKEALGAEGVGRQELQLRMERLLARIQEELE